jgi:hypothetical protein
MQQVLWLPDLAALQSSFREYVAQRATKDLAQPRANDAGEEAKAHLGRIEVPATGRTEVEGEASGVGHFCHGGH